MFDTWKKEFNEVKKMISEDEIRDIATEKKKSKQLKKVLEMSKRVAAEQAKQETPHEKPVKAVEHVWNESFSSRVHVWTFWLLGFVSITATSFLSFYWRNELLKIYWRDAATCVIAECLAICWSICWWWQISPKIITARHPLKHNKFSFMLALVMMTFTVPIEQSYAANLTIGATRSLAIYFICFGGVIAVHFGAVWSAYLSNKSYGKISFIDYCNLPVGEE